MLPRLLVLIGIIVSVSVVVSEVAIGDATPEAPSALTEENRSDLNKLIEKLDVEEETEEPGTEASLELWAHLTPPEIPSSVSVTLENVWDKTPVDMPIFDRIVKAVLRSRSVPNGKDRPKDFYWERGGVAVPREELLPLAIQWSATYLAALKDVESNYGVALPVWGALATMANEGGFWEGALNYEARKWASEHSCKVLTTETWRGNTIQRKIETKLVEKFQQTYDVETVWKILNDPHFKDAQVQVPDRKKGGTKWVKIQNKADGGPWQMRFSMKGMTRETFDRIMSMQPGIYLGAEEMAKRALAYSQKYRVEQPHPRPWQLWPSARATDEKNLAYNDKITSVARWLGARKDEIPQGYAYVDSSGRKPAYRINVWR